MGLTDCPEIRRQEAVLQKEEQRRKADETCKQEDGLREEPLLEMKLEATGDILEEVGWREEDEDFRQLYQRPRRFPCL